MSTTNTTTPTTLVSLAQVPIDDISDVDDRFTKGRLYQIYKSDPSNQNTDPSLYLTLAQNFVKTVQDKKSKRRNNKTNGWDMFYRCPDAWLHYDNSKLSYMTTFYLGRIFQFILQTDKNFKASEFLAIPNKDDPDIVMVMAAEDLLNWATFLRKKFMSQRIDKKYSDYVLRCLDCNDSFRFDDFNVLSDWSYSTNHNDNYCDTCKGGLKYHQAVDSGAGL